MTQYDSKIITCKKCGRRFTWTAGEQRFFNKNRLDDPVHCEHCRGRNKDYHRSSQVDHPAHPIPAFPPPTPPKRPVPQQSPPPPTAVPPKRPSWWANPFNQNTALIWLLSALAVIILIILLINVF